MSKFSGEYDLCDHISGLGGWFDRDGNSVTFGQEGVSAYYSDELKDFEAFKELTKGKIYQHYKIKVDEYNQQFVKDHCNSFNFIEHKKIIADSRTKSGFRETVFYTYIYWNKEYEDLKTLNKHGVFIEAEINFNTLLDLIPYYPYRIAFCAADKTLQHVVISNESLIESTFKDNLQNGYVSKINFKEELQKHYLEVCEKYFLKNKEKRTKQISLLGYSPLHNGYYELVLPEPADYMHDLKFIWKNGNRKTHWAEPILDSPTTVLISEMDIDWYLADDIKNNNIMIEYVQKLEV